MNIFEKVKSALSGTDAITDQKIKDVTDIAIDNLAEKVKETTADEIKSSEIKKPEKDGCCGGNCGG